MVQRVIDRMTAPPPPPREDPLINLIGQIGRWQLVVYIPLILVKLSSAWVQLGVVFLAPATTFRCEQFAGNARAADPDTCYADCARYGYDSRPLGSTVVSQWHLVCERRWMASFTQMVLQLGILVGSMLIGFLSDRLGRRPTFLASVVLLVVFGFAIPFSPSFGIFTTLRFFLGVACAGTMVPSFVIVMEVIGPAHRELLGCIFHLPFIFGHMLLPVFAYFYRDWDQYSLALAVPPLLYLGYFFVVSESPRWLVSVGRVDEATRIVTKAAAMNKLPTDKVEVTLKEISDAVMKNKSDEPKLNYLDLFRTASLRRKTVCSCYLWLVGGLTYFGVNQYIGQTSSDPFASVAAAGAMQIPSNLLAIWLIRRFGRKAVVVSAFALDGVLLLALSAVAGYWATLAVGTLAVCLASIVNIALYLYSSELFPTVARNMGMGLCSTAMRAGSMAAPFVAGLAPTAGWLPAALFGVLPLTAALACLPLPDTRRAKLPDTIDEVEANAAPNT